MAFVDSRGARIHYEITGNPAGPAVLFIQGVGVIGAGWQPQIDGLCARYRVLSFDNRGIGQSTLGSGRMTIEALADDAFAVLDAAGLRSAHVVGHSMGGVIAQQVALRMPARVRSLSFLCTFASGWEATKLSLDKLILGLRTYVGPNAWRRQAFLEMILPREYIAQTPRADLIARLQTLFGHDLSAQPPIALKQLGAMRKFDAASTLHRLGEIPTLVLSGAADRIALPAYGRRLADAIPGARYVEIPDTGHALPIQLADKTNQLLDAHLQRADQTPRTT